METISAIRHPGEVLEQARTEEPLGLLARLLEHLVGRGRRDRPHRLDEQLQEVRLGQGPKAPLAAPLSGRAGFARAAV